MQKLTVNLDSVVTGIAEGEGALNYLSKDTIFVQRLEATMKNILLVCCKTRALFPNKVQIW